MLRLAIALLLAALPSLAHAQSKPNWSYGYVPSAGEYGAAFAKKQDLLQYTPLNQAGGTMQGKLQAAPSTTNRAGFSLLPGIAPSSPSEGDFWVAGGTLYGRLNGVTTGFAPLTNPIFSGTTTASKLAITGSGSTGDVSGMSVTAQGSVVRALSSRAADFPTLPDFGPVSGSDWTPAVNTAQSAGSMRIGVPEGSYSVTFDQYGAANKVYAGPGQFTLSNGFKDAPWRTLVTQFKASPTGWSPSPTDQWTGDFSQFYAAARSLITASATPPTSTSYVNMPMAAMTRWGWETYAGFNASASDHAQGRTGQWMHDFALRHSGQGDATVFNFNVAANSARAGATHFLANPAVQMYGGNVYATSQAPGAYLQGSEVIFSDGGVSVAAIDRVRNYNRTKAATGLGEVWIHDRPQVQGFSGNLPIDGFYVPGGKAKRGLDFGGADFSAGNNAAVILQPGMRIFFGGYADADAAGLRTVSTSLGFTSVYQDANGYLHIDAGTNSKAVILDNLPTSATGLPSGAIWKDTANGNVLKVAP